MKLKQCDLFAVEMIEIIRGKSEHEKAPYALLHTIASSVNQKTPLVYSEVCFLYCLVG